MRSWLALVLAAAALFLAAWIVVPAPTYFLLTFGVGAPEVSPWIALGALVSMAFAFAEVRTSIVARIAVLAGIIAFALACMPIAAFRGTARRFATEMQSTTMEPPNPARSATFAIGDFIHGIDVGHAQVTRGIRVTDRNGDPLSLDVYQPASPESRTKPCPILVQIYGGAWQRGQPTDDANFATLLASHGWLVFALDYRHAPAVRWPLPLEDVDASLSWIRDHASAYGGDTARVALMGRSAGAHLAMLAAYRHPALTVRGVVSYYGPSDLVDAYRHPPRPDPLHVRRVEETFIGGTLGDKPAQYADASPIRYAIRAVPPTLLIYGRRDHIVEARYGRQLRDRLSAAGARVTYLEIPWAEHAFDAVFNGLSAQLALYHTERFLAWAVK